MDGGPCCLAFLPSCGRGCLLGPGILACLGIRPDLALKWDGFVWEVQAERPGVTKAPSFRPQHGFPGGLLLWLRWDFVSCVSVAC